MRTKKPKKEHQQKTQDYQKKQDELAKNVLEEPNYKRWTTFQNENPAVSFATFQKYKNNKMYNFIHTSTQTKKGIEEAIKDIKEGRVYTTEQLNKELAL